MAKKATQIESVQPTNKENLIAKHTNDIYTFRKHTPTHTCMQTYEVSSCGRH